MKTIKAFLLGMAVVLLVGTSIIAPNNVFASKPSHEKSLRQDREAILNLAGRYRVSFRFREMIPMEEGYRLQEPFTAGGTEVIQVIEDEGDRITLQHFLLVDQGSTVIKHWRQVWTYEDSLLYTYEGNRTWTPRRLSPEKVEGHWSWTVFQVGDSLRYETCGTFTHHPEVSSWESRRFWRPLPRREKKKRDDYDVMGGRHRLTIMDDVWYHEQDNSKIILNDRGEVQSIVAREVGLNTYTRRENIDVSPVEAYWQSHRVFWEEVQSYWQRVMGLRQTIRLRATVQGDPLWNQLFELADQTGKDVSTKTRKMIQKTIDRFRIHPESEEKR